MQRARTVEAVGEAKVLEGGWVTLPLPQRRAKSRSAGVLPARAETAAGVEVCRVRGVTRGDTYI